MAEAAYGSYEWAKNLYPNASEYLLNSLVNLKSAQEKAFSQGGDLGALFDQELKLSEELNKNEKVATKSESESPLSSYAESLKQQTAENEKVVPAAPQESKEIDKDTAVKAAKAANLFKESKEEKAFKEEEKPKKDDVMDQYLSYYKEGKLQAGQKPDNIIASSLSGPKNYSTPSSSVKEWNPQGPYTPIKNYGSDTNPMFMPSGPSKDPWKAKQEMDKKYGSGPSKAKEKEMLAKGIDPFIGMSKGQIVLASLGIFG